MFKLLSYYPSAALRQTLARCCKNVFINTCQTVINFHPFIDRIVSTYECQLIANSSKKKIRMYEHTIILYVTQNGLWISRQPHWPYTSLKTVRSLLFVHQLSVLLNLIVSSLGSSSSEHVHATIKSIDLLLCGLLSLGDGGCGGRCITTSCGEVKWVKELISSRVNVRRLTYCKTKTFEDDLFRKRVTIYEQYWSINFRRLSFANVPYSRDWNLTEASADDPCVAKLPAAAAPPPPPPPPPPPAEKTSVSMRPFFRRAANNTGQ